MSKDRYIIKTGAFGQYFYDNSEDKEVKLQEAIDIMNGIKSKKSLFPINVKVNNLAEKLQVIGLLVKNGAKIHGENDDNDQFSKLMYFNNIKYINVDNNQYLSGYYHLKGSSISLQELKEILND